MQNETNKIVKNTSKWVDIKKTLSNCSDKYLIDFISDLYLISSQNKNFIEAHFIKNDAILTRYKNIIKKHIAPSEPWKGQPVKLKDAKKVICYYKKATDDIVGLIDLMICYVEYGTDFLCEFGDMHDQYYYSLESVFNNALKLIESSEHKDMLSFKKRLNDVVKKSEDLGYGYYDSISDMLNEAFSTP